jgi:hypothetical protein
MVIKQSALNHHGELLSINMIGSYNIDAMIVYKFDHAKGTWQNIHTIGGKHSIFVGLSYPFHMDSEWIKPNNVCS